MFFLANTNDDAANGATNREWDWISTVFKSFLVFIIFIAIGGLFAGRDHNTQGFVVFIALSLASVYLAKHFPKVLSFHRISLLMAVVVILGGALLELIFNLIDSDSKYITTYIEYDLIGKILFIVITCIILPIIEEIYFRGLLYQIISRYIGYKASALITLSLFTLGHNPSIKQVLPIALSGALFTWLVQRTGSVISGIVAHSATNCFWLIFGLMMP